MIELESVEIIEDVEAWCEEVLIEASIEAVAERNYDLYMSFAASLGELSLRQIGIELLEV